MPGFVFDGVTQRTLADLWVWDGSISRWVVRGWVWDGVSAQLWWAPQTIFDVYEEGFAVAELDLLKVPRIRLIDIETVAEGERDNQVFKEIHKILQEAGFALTEVEVLQISRIVEKYIEVLASGSEDIDVFKELEIIVQESGSAVTVVSVDKLSRIVLKNIQSLASGAETVVLTKAIFRTLQEAGSALTAASLNKVNRIVQKDIQSLASGAEAITLTKFIFRSFTNQEAGSALDAVTVQKLTRITHILISVLASGAETINLQTESTLQFSGADWLRTSLAACPTPEEIHCIRWNYTGSPSGMYIRIHRSTNSGAYEQVVSGVSTSSAVCSGGGFTFSYSTILPYGDDPFNNWTDFYRYKLELRRNSDNTIVAEIETANIGSLHSDCIL